MAWQVYVFPHAISTHAEELETPEEVEEEERSKLHRALVSIAVILLLAVCVWISTKFKHH